MRCRVSTPPVPCHREWSSPGRQIPPRNLQETSWISGQIRVLWREYSKWMSNDHELIWIVSCISSFYLKGFSVSLKLFQIHTKIAISRKKPVSSTARLPNLKWVEWSYMIKYDCWSIAELQSCRFGPWMNTGCCCLAPLTTETANGSAGNAFRIGCIGLGAMRISLAVLGSYSTSWTSKRNLLKDSERIWNLRDMYNQLRSLTLPYAKQTSKVLAPARSSPHPSAIVSTGKSHSIRKRSYQVPRFSAWFPVFTNHGNNSHVRSWNTRSLEKPEAVSTREKHRAIGISSCISEKYWELWKLTN